MSGYPNSQGSVAAAIPVWAAAYYTQVTASGQIKASAGFLAGLLVVASSSGNISLVDSLTATGTVLYTGTVTAGQVVSLPAQVATVNGLYFVLNSGTATVNVLWR